MVIGGYKNYFTLDNNEFFTTMLNAFNFARNVYVNVFGTSCFQGGPCFNVTVEKHLLLAMESQMEYVSCLSFALNQLDQYNRWIYQALDFQYNWMKLKIENCTNADGTINNDCIVAELDPNFTDLWSWIKNIFVKLSITSEVGYHLGECIKFSHNNYFNKLRTYQLEFNQCTGFNWFANL